MGHYLACRYYKVNATPPYFIPAPPLFLAGTFGAFIKIRSAIPSRRALFDIGLAGPLAGFVVALPVAVIGVLTAGTPLDPTGRWMYFNDPLLFRLISKLAGIPLDPNTPTNPYYMAAWIGLLVTSLNLDAGGPTRRGSRNVFLVRRPRTLDHRACRFCNYGRARVPGLLVARQPQRLSLRSLIGGHAKGPPPTTSRDGTFGDKANRDRDRDVDRVRALFPAVPNYD